VAKVRPAPGRGPRRWETGTPSFESVAATAAAADYLADTGRDRRSAEEAELGAQLLAGLHSIAGVTVWGPPTMADRVPTVAFTVAGVPPPDVARALADDRIAVWDGDCYAVEVVGQLGLAESGGVVRAGVVAYITEADVDRLLASVERVAAGRPSSEG